MPRGLYGRAALILILPVVFLQLVVSVVFIQRHFTNDSFDQPQLIVAIKNLKLLCQPGLAPVCAQQSVR